jgi:hypothetical protein
MKGKKEKEKKKREKEKGRNKKKSLYINNTIVVCLYYIKIHKNKIFKNNI